MTEKKAVRDIIMQGENFSSILCTSTMDIMDKECPIPAYKFRDTVEIAKMGFEDDIADIQTCNTLTKELNIEICLICLAYY